MPLQSKFKVWNQVVRFIRSKLFLGRTQHATTPMISSGSTPAPAPVDYIYCRCGLLGSSLPKKHTHWKLLTIWQELKTRRSTNHFTFNTTILDQRTSNAQWNWVLEKSSKPFSRFYHGASRYLNRKNKHFFFLPVEFIHEF